MKKKYWIISILLFLFFLLMIGVLLKKQIFFDDDIYNGIFSLRNTYMDAFMKEITQLGNPIPILCITVILLLLIPNEERNILGISVVGTVLINQGLKRIVRRARPEHLRLIKQGGFSFPSGHAMISIAIYGFLIYYVYKKIKNKYLKISLIILLSLIIIGIGMSRIYLGVHYPSDIVSGYLLALSILLLVISIVESKLGGKTNGKNGCK